MNSQHLRTFIWLRWRLLVRQLQRSGFGNLVILAILAVLGFLGVAALSVIAFMFGLFFVDKTPAENVPAFVMYAWDVIVVLFLIAWGAALLAELQRSEALSLDKFLHLPVSLSGVFVLNYLSSLASFTLAAILPIMVGFGLGVCFSIGPAMLLVLPLLAAFLLMVTAISYQFQGWLASLMVNKRQRRNVIVVATIVFVILCQLPNLVNFMGVWDRPNQEAQNGQILDPDDQKKEQELNKERDQRKFDEIKNIAVIVNLVLPPGWLPLGAQAAASGNVVPALLGTLGMTLIGSASLWRAYRTTIRLYTGQFTAGKGRASAVGQENTSPTAAVPGKELPGKASAAGNMLEGRLPWVSEQTAVIALGGLRSLLRAPEAKMLLLTPLFMLLIFGMMLFQGKINVADFARPFLGFGAISMSLFFLIGLVGNQFAFDRDGFRVFVLSPAPRRDILLGKNLAMLPLAVALGILPIIVLQVMFPMGIEYFLAMPVQFLSMFLLFCMLANWLSMFGPMPIAPGSLKPTKVQLIPILLQFLFIFLFPAAMSPALLPIGIAYWLGERWPHGVYLSATLVLCLTIILIYRLILTWQGRVLQSLELKILQTITTKAE